MWREWYTALFMTWVSVEKSHWGPEQGLEGHIVSKFTK